MLDCSTRQIVYSTVRQLDGRPHRPKQFDGWLWCLGFVWRAAERRWGRGPSYCILTGAQENYNNLIGLIQMTSFLGISSKLECSFFKHIVKWFYWMQNRYPSKACWQSLSIVDGVVCPFTETAPSIGETLRTHSMVVHYMYYVGENLRDDILMFWLVWSNSTSLGMFFHTIY